MPVDVPMPKLGLTMEEGLIVEWLVDEGAEVAADQPIFRIETDKTETEVGSPGGGRLHQIGRVGDVYPCGVLVGVLLAEGEDPPVAASAAAPAPDAVASVAPAVTAAAGATATAASSAQAGAAAAAGGRIVASPNARRVAAERGVPLAAVAGTGPGGRIVSEDVEAYTPAPARLGGASAGTIATSAARQLAELLGVDLTMVAIDPVEQRITRDGVAVHVRALLGRLAPTGPSPSAGPQAPASAGLSVSMPLLQEPRRTVRLSGMRGTIAKRMHASLQEMAQLTLTMDATMDAVLAHRADRKASAAAVPSITDYVVAATARALLAHPRLNAQVTADGIAELPEVHVGLAVAVDNGLLVPVIRDTAGRDLADLAAESARLAAAARAGTLTPGDLEGGTFSVSTLGMFGVDAFTPVINPPNAGILGVGRLRDDVVVVDGKVSTAKRMTLSLTWDHRVVDGAPAAELCRTIVELLADPGSLDAVSA